MKILIFILVCIYSYQVSANEGKIVKSSVNRVTVFTQGAQVFRSTTVSLSPGVTRLIFSEISPQINPASIQAGGKGSFVVMDVKHNIKYPTPPSPEQSALPVELMREMLILEDSLTELGFRRDEYTEKLGALNLQKEMITKNKLAKGEGKSDSLEVLKQAIEFFNRKLTEINIQIGKTKRDELKNNKQLVSVTKRLSELKTYKNSEEPQKNYEPIHQVVVSVSTEAAAIGSVEISYMVSQAGWIPSYDLRSVTAAAPVQITYKASVHQNTGEDWSNVKLKLSTSNPNRSNVKPTLPTWFINYYTGLRETRIPAMARSQSADNVTTLSTADEEMLNKKMGELSPAQSAANYSQLVETMTNVEFDIKLVYDIPSDGGSHIVSVKTDTLSATYMHYLVPKLESDAFLLAKVTGWENLSLLPGKANIFYEGTYVGETVLNPSVINDTLVLSLGRDNGITVTRTRMPVKEGNKLLGNDITKTIAYELRIKNNKGKLINLAVEDQVPVSRIKEIKVGVKDVGNANYNETTGLLKWDIALESKGYKSLKFSYEVTHNKDMPLSMY
jgi:uncharacterized protein (TIGR02231 family)